VQVTKLCGPEPLTKYLVLLVVSIQVLAAYSLQNTPFWSLRFWGVAYIVGATANQNLFLAIHEISHNLAFRKAELNRVLAVFANLPIGIPYSASFRVCVSAIKKDMCGLVGRIEVDSYSRII
jgi:sphingolipid 4-desaturase/C4-monooxygenase